MVVDLIFYIIRYSFIVFLIYFIWCCMQNFTLNENVRSSERLLLQILFTVVVFVLLLNYVEYVQYSATHFCLLHVCHARFAGNSFHLHFYGHMSGVNHSILLNLSCLLPSFGVVNLELVSGFKSLFIVQCCDLFKKTIKKLNLCLILATRIRPFKFLYLTISSALIAFP